MLRLQRALAAARSGVSLADTAMRAGFADQAHLSREVRALAGISLGGLLAKS
jgi:AraC-like DNA-binding protein